MKEDDMKHRQDLERKRLPKIQRNDLRTKLQAKKKQLRAEKNRRESLAIVIGGLSAVEKEKLREVFKIFSVVLNKCSMYDFLYRY